MPTSRGVLIQEDPEFLPSVSSDFFEPGNLYEVKIEFPKNHLFTFLPERVPKVGLVYPRITRLGFRWGEEIVKAMELGAKILETGRRVEYRVQHNIFESFIDSVFALKKKYTLEKSPLKYFFKLLLNNLYGKLAQRLFPSVKFAGGELRN